MIISRLSANVLPLQFAQCQCTYLAARSLPMYIPCSLLSHCGSVHTLQLAYCECIYLAARSLPVYIPCSLLTASVHTLQLAHCQCTHLATRSVTAAVYIPCSSLTASVHTLHVNKKYTRRPHERSTVQFIGHVDLVFRTSTLPHRINPKLLWVLSVHAVSTAQNR